MKLHSIHVNMNNDAFSRSGRHFTDIKVMLASITLNIRLHHGKLFMEHLFFWCD